MKTRKPDNLAMAECLAQVTIKAAKHATKCEKNMKLWRSLAIIEALLILGVACAYFNPL